MLTALVVRLAARKMVVMLMRMLKMWNEFLSAFKKS